LISRQQQQDTTAFLTRGYGSLWAGTWECNVKEGDDEKGLTLLFILAIIIKNVEKLARRSIEDEILLWRR